MIAGVGTAMERWAARPGRVRAQIAWEALGELEEGQRARLARSFVHRAAEEATAMAAFAELADELTAVGAPAGWVAAVRRVVDDEAHHASLCARAARALGARGDRAMARTVRSDKRYPLRERIALTIVGSLCVGESWSAAVFADELDRVTDPVLRAIETDILAEEVSHGRLGFAWLADAWMTLPYSTRLLVEHSLPSLFAGLEARHAARRPLLIRTMTERILPELDESGMRATRAWHRRHS